MHYDGRQPGQVPRDKYRQIAVTSKGAAIIIVIWQYGHVNIENVSYLRFTKRIK